MSINLQTQQKLTLDFNQKLYKTVIAKQYDQGSRFVPIQCTDNGIPFLLDSSFDVQVKVLTPDNRALLNTVPVQDDGTLLLELTETMLAYPGKAEVEIVIYDIPNSKRLSTMNFNLLIEPSAYDDERILSSDEFNALTELLEKADSDYTYVITAAQASADAARVSETNAKTSEINTKTSETNASASAVNSAASAKLSESWAVGGTDTRIDEDTDNSKYYASIASARAEEAGTSANSANKQAILAESYFHGGTGTREDEDENCVTAYYEKIKSVADINIANTEKTGLVKAGDDVNVGIDGTMTVPKLTELENLIKGASSASVADTLQAMVTALNDASLADYKVGTNILIKAVNVPDFWISEIYSEKVTYEYTDDDSLIEQVNLNNGTLQTGYYGISFLETDKVVLTDYATNDYVNAKSNEMKSYTDNQISALNKNSIGLENVENVSVNNQTPTFSQAATLENIASGENNSTLWGKVSKAIAELISHISNAAIHITSAERSAWNAKQDASTAITTSNIGSQSVNYASNAGNASNDGNGNNIANTYLPKTGGTMTGALNFANGTYNLVGDDVKIGDVNAAGCLGILGNNAATGIMLMNYDNAGASNNMKLYNATGVLKVENESGAPHILKVGDCVMIKTDGEGGNIQITTPNNKFWEIDAYNENLRIYKNEDGAIYTPAYFNRNDTVFSGSINVLGGIYSNGKLLGGDGTVKATYGYSVSVSADGTVDTTVNFGVTYSSPPAFSFAITSYGGNFHDYLVFTQDITTTYAVVRFYRRTGSQAATMNFNWSAVGVV